MKTLLPSKLSVFYDAEFTGLHQNTTPISIGIVTEKCCYFYAEFTDYDKSQVTDWIQDNVITRLMFNDKPDNYIDTRIFYNNGLRTDDYNIRIKGDKELIKNELLKWLANISHNDSDKEIQFFTDCYAYDWVILNDLIGKNGSALEIPSYINYIPIDLSTALFFKWIDPDISREEFIGQNAIDNILLHDPFSKRNTDDIKHNCLWDAFVCREAFYKI